MATFEAVVPILDVRVAHGLIPNSQLNLANGFPLGTAKLLVKFDSVSAMLLFHFITYLSLWSAPYMSSLKERLSMTDSIRSPEKNSGMSMNIPAISEYPLKSPILDWST